MLIWAQVILVSHNLLRSHLWKVIVAQQGIAIVKLKQLKIIEFPQILEYNATSIKHAEPFVHYRDKSVYIEKSI